MVKIARRIVIMNKIQLVRQLLNDRYDISYERTGGAFAPANIALIKYWGKRNTELNLPVTSSLSVSLGEKGTQTEISLLKEQQDKILLNGKLVSADTAFSKRLIDFLNLFRSTPDIHFLVETNSNIPIGAGLASSASGFASIVKALNRLFQWRLENRELSILARLGSGSAARSLQHGFVKWYAGSSQDGMDSFGERLSVEWAELRVGLLIFSEQQKSISSRDAMRRTVETSCYYSVWADKVKSDLHTIEEAIEDRQFDSFGYTAESNALAMHASMLTAWPPICYLQPKTVEMMNCVWSLRQEGLPVYFTQDAGPNLKLLFLAKDEGEIRAQFPKVEIIVPFIG